MLDFLIFMLSVIMLNVIKLNVIMLSVILPNVIMPKVIMTNVIMLNVVAPQSTIIKLFLKLPKIEFAVADASSEEMRRSSSQEPTS
jgi:hypothetical protein